VARREARALGSVDRAGQADDDRGFLAALFERSPIAEGLLDHELRYVHVNPALARLNGAPLDAHRGRRVADVIPELAPTIVPLMRRALDGETVELEVSGPVPGGEGETGDWLVSYYPVPGDGGQIGGVGIAVVDITERVRAERARRASEARRDAIVESSLDAIVTMTTEGRIVEFNSAAEEMFGLSREDAVGRELAETLVPERLRSSHREGLDRYRRTGEAAVVGKRLQLPALRADGTEFPVELTVTRVDMEGIDGPGLFSATLRDLTEVERAREERAQLERALAEAQKNDAIGRLAGGVAHDFNNLLTVILGYSDILVRRLEGSGLMLHAMQIRGAAERGARLTRQMLAFSRQQVLEPRLLTVDEVVRGVQPMLESLVGEDVEVVCDLGSERLPVMADSAELEQVLLNLAANARDAMPGGGRLSISTRTTELDPEVRARHVLRPGRFVLLEVHDTGVGMDATTKLHAFEPFFTTKEVGQGTGLGLASARGVVEQLGGAIEVESTPGQGSTFRIYLPEADRGATAAVDTRPAARATILVVEDEEGLRRLATMVLEEAGFAVLAARSAEDALGLAARHGGPIDLLLTDVVLPQMNGTRLAERLRGERRGLRVAYMTGYGQSAEPSAADDLEADVLQKPFAPPELVGHVEAALGLRLAR
jgi:two-component system, cell cycle sensor histidine kinase and response regulator CckA